MGKFRKKPVVIDAWQFDGSYNSVRHLIKDDGAVSYCGNARGQHVEIKTLEGVMRADPGDYIIRGVKGEFYPCKPDIFEATYEPAEPA